MKMTYQPKKRQRMKEHGFKKEEKNLLLNQNPRDLKC